MLNWKRDVRFTELIRMFLEFYDFIHTHSFCCKAELIRKKKCFIRYILFPDVSDGFPRGHGQADVVEGILNFYIILL